MAKLMVKGMAHGAAQSMHQCDKTAAKGGVIVLGEALLDIFPSRTVVGGAPFNVACSVAALGVDVCLITRLGNDANGDLVRRRAIQFGVGLNGLQIDEMRPTGTVQVRVTPTENHFSIADDQAWDYLELQAGLAAIEGTRAKFLYFGTLAQRSTQARLAIRNLVSQFVGRFGGTVYLDLNLREMPDIRAICADSLALADILKVNEDELRKLLEWFAPSGEAAEPWHTQEFLAAVAALIKKYELSGLIVTRGADGYAYFDARGSLVIDGHSVQNVAIVDTVGAGDSFSAMFLASQVRGVPLEASLMRASELAAAVCGIQGAVPPSPDFYARWIRPGDGLRCADDLNGVVTHLEGKVRGE